MPCYIASPSDLQHACLAPLLQVGGILNPLSPVYALPLVSARRQLSRLKTLPLEHLAIRLPRLPLEVRESPFGVVTEFILRFSQLFTLNPHRKSHLTTDKISNPVCGQILPSCLTSLELCGLAVRPLVPRRPAKGVQAKGAPRPSAATASPLDGAVSGRPSSADRHTLGSGGTGQGTGWSSGAAASAASSHGDGHPTSDGSGQLTSSAPPAVRMTRSASAAAASRLPSSSCPGPKTARGGGGRRRRGKKTPQRGGKGRRRIPAATVEENPSGGLETATEPQSFAAAAAAAAGGTSGQGGERKQG